MSAARPHGVLLFTKAAHLIIDATELLAVERNGEVRA